MVFFSSQHSFNYFSLTKWATDTKHLPSWLCSLPLSQFSGIVQNFGDKLYQTYYPRPTKPHQQTTHRALSEVHLPHLTRKSDKRKPRAVLPFPTITTKSCLSCTGGTHSLITFHEQSSLQGCAVTDTPLKRVHCSSQIPARQCMKHSSNQKPE